jgi:tRNA pseudouridine55 synthase
MDGVIVLDKPAGWTSHDAVAKMRRLTKMKRIGHLGTLDPMATGVLPLVIGKATRLARFYLKMDKTYEGVIGFGWATTTYDAEGEPTSPKVQACVKKCDLEAVLDRFRGTFEQFPPPVSAKKVAGVPAYRLARRNIRVELPPVEVTVFSLDLLESSDQEARVLVHCSAGTYLRAIAHEAGLALGCGAFLKSLRRTAAGVFTIEMARSIEELASLASEEMLSTALVPAVELLPEFPSERVDRVTAGYIRQGRDFRVSPFRTPRGAKYVKAISDEGELLAIGEVRLPNLYHPILVL